MSLGFDSNCRSGGWLTLAVLLALAPLVGGCAGNTGAVPSSPLIDKPEISSADGSFLLSWDTTSPAIPRRYEYQRYRDGSLEHAATLSGKTFFHQALQHAQYEFRLRGCGSDDACSSWSSLALACELEQGQLFCWQELEDDDRFALPGRDELGGAAVQVWDYLLPPTEDGCYIPVRAIRKAGQAHYTPLVYFHGGAWRSDVMALRHNGGLDSLYHYKNREGLAPHRLQQDDPAPVYDRFGRYDIGATFAGFASDRGLLVKLLNEGFMVFDVEYISINPSAKPDDQCQGRWRDVVVSAAAVVEELYDDSTHEFRLPVAKLATRLPVLIGDSAGGHIAHYLTTHQPEKVRQTINMSGMLSWDQYGIWKGAGAVEYSIYLEEFILSTVADPIERGRMANGKLPESMPDIVGAADFFIPQAVSLNSFESFYNRYETATPPVYHINFAYDLLYGEYTGDGSISGAQGEFFCSYTSAGNHHVETVVIETKSGHNSRRLVDCGGGNYLDQFHDDPHEPEDHLALVRAHAVMTLSQWRAVREWLRLGLVSTASW